MHVHPWPPPPAPSSPPDLPLQLEAAADSIDLGSAPAASIAILVAIAVAAAVGTIVLHRVVLWSYRRRAAKKQTHDPHAVPTVEWPITRSFGVFLSHYKVEAGVDARLLKELLHRSMRAPVYLDVSELTDLRGLFANGAPLSAGWSLVATPAGSSASRARGGWRVATAGVAVEVPSPTLTLSARQACSRATRCCSSAPRASSRGRGACSSSTTPCSTT